MKKKVIIVIAAVFIVLFAAAGIYLGSYYHATEDVDEYFEEDKAYSIAKMDNQIILMPENPVAGIIFYPGAKVEYTAYIPLFADLADDNIACIILKEPFNMAFFDIDEAEGITENFLQISKWYLCGHSLGGAMACYNIAENLDEYDGLILLAAFSTKDLSSTDLKILSIYGSEDEVLDIDDYNKNKSNLPDDNEEYVIEGGCHGYFGNYGDQKGDGTPTISREEQQELTAERILEFITK